MPLRCWTILPHPVPGAQHVGRRLRRRAGQGDTAGPSSWGEALRTGAIFGGIEAITPVIGWAAGRAASRYIAAFDHWIAFGLLGAIGIKMIWDAARRHPEDESRKAIPSPCWR